MVGRVLCRLQAYKKVDVRRSGDAWRPLCQDLQSDTGDDNPIVWRVVVLRDREGGDDAVRARGEGAGQHGLKHGEEHSFNERCRENAAR